MVEKITTILKDNGVWFEQLIHQPVRTSEEAVRVRTGYTIAQGMKSLIVKGKRSGRGRQYIMIVVPGNSEFDKQKLRAETGYTDVRFATEREVGEITGGVLSGGVPPWGSLFQLSAFADKAIFANEKVIFNAGDRRVSIAMSANDYLRLEAPTVVAISEQ